MADLLMRGVEEALLLALKTRVVAQGRSAEAKHQEILASVLTAPRKRSFAEVLMAMPNVGRDEDFERLDDRTPTPSLSD